MKRLRQLEEEKAVVEEGLQIAARVRDSYSKRLEDILARLHLGSDSRQGAAPPSPSASSSEAAQERLIFELRSIRELNQRLGSLAASGRPGGFPTHYDLHMKQQQVREPVQQVVSATSEAYDGGLQLLQAQVLTLTRQVDRLKMQNKMLTEEVGRKSNFITNLEQEKSLLIKQLFQARSSSAAAASRGPTPVAVGGRSRPDEEDGGSESTLM